MALMLTLQRDMKNKSLKHSMQLALKTWNILYLENGQILQGINNVYIECCQLSYFFLFKRHSQKCWFWKWLYL